MVNTSADSPLFALPLELREQIYKDVLFEPTSGTGLLLACKEIHSVAHKFIYQRSLIFRGQNALHEWIRHTPPEYLHYVTTIVIELHEVDLKPILDRPVSHTRNDSPPHLATWELHEKEIDKLCESMRKLHKLRSLTVRGLPRRPSYFYREFIDRFLKALGSVWKDLQELNLEGCIYQQSLDFLSSLSDLRSFSFDGFSRTSDTATLSVLAGLRHLTSLTIVSQPQFPTPSDSPYFGHVPLKRQSVTSEIISATLQLSSFAVTERPLHIPSPAMFFTPEVFTSLQHHATLRKFSTSLTYTPNSETLGSLAAFLQKSSITMLELDWPDLTVETLRTYTILSEKLREMWVRVTSISVASGILELIIAKREGGDATELRTVVLMRDNWDDGDSTGTNQSHSGLGEERAERMESVAHSKSDIHISPATSSDPAPILSCQMEQLQLLGIKLLWHTVSACHTFPRAII
ncbi:hypothetical protein BU24DRAFT_455686 [Aaosphaeria arxii CBS 175.79]|uniref:Uncharacterized protein n=1 Tax=Aaosphaeria arxii CBS 175.79 TaxID=1450172 RepID=A0A6A5XAH2_9PLEO|nr:uncharacterized protein BU24DRAFT_455686 [Aaosphaeria arxii CBS 175.79]KAF2009777.1 hypothetical protein BU24DRAFT_455686 [Aaosphaeria arxii CBS 175.79]